MIFISCEQDESVIDPAQEEVVPDYESISSARDWFFSQTGGDVLMEFKSPTKSTGSSKQTLPLLGDWDSGQIRRIEHIRNVEVPVYSVEDEEAYAEAVNGIIDLKRGQLAPKYDDFPSRTRFVVQTNEETGTTRGFMMTVIPNEEYMASGGSIDSIDYYYRGADFSGLIVFNHLDGSFANAWKYEEGIINEGYLLSGAKNVNNLKSTLTVTVKYCNDVYASSGGYTVYKGRHCWYRHTNVTLLTTGPGGGAGGGGSSGGSSGGAPVTGGGSSSGRVSSNNGGYIEPLEPIQHSSTPVIDDIASNNFLDFTQTQLIEDALDELIDFCPDKYIYNELVAQGKKFNFKMNSSLGGLAGYDAATKTFSFRNNDAISSGKLKEEFFHAFQDAFYTGGISQYGTTGKVNIEFEAKLYKDVTTVLDISCCSAFNDYSNAPGNIKTQYRNWVEKIAENPNELTSQDYTSWLKLFNQYHPKYSSPVHSDLKAPEALYSIIYLSSCF